MHQVRRGQGVGRRGGEVMRSDASKEEGREGVLSDLLKSALEEGGRIAGRRALPSRNGEREEAMGEARRWAAKSRSTSGV